MKGSKGFAHNLGDTIIIFAASRIASGSVANMEAPTRRLSGLSVDFLKITAGT